MSKKITISVPDDLHEKMERWKHSYNFSGIFQKSISELIRKKEDFQKRLKEDPKMEEIVERLKKEREDSKYEWFDTGKTTGLEWSKFAHYDEIQIVVNTPDERIPMEKLVEYDDANEEWFEEQVFEMYPIADMTDAAMNFEAGFIEAVREFWAEVESKL